MAKFLTEFNTYAEYSAATLNYPNVSLIKSTGKVYYKNIYAGSTLGDILMWDNVNNKLVTTIGGSWDSTAWPIAQYIPIAINIYPASQASDGKSRFMALKWASNSSAKGSASVVHLCWGPNSTTAGDITSTDETALNGRENTNKAVAVMPGTSGNTQADYPAFYAVNQFHTSGTTAGDWYLPSKGELAIYESNYSTINTQIQAIKTASSSIVDTVNDYLWSSTESGTDKVYVLRDNPMFAAEGRGNTYWQGVRGVIAL